VLRVVAFEQQDPRLGGALPVVDLGIELRRRSLRADEKFVEPSRPAVSVADPGVDVVLEQVAEPGRPGVGRPDQRAQVRKPGGEQPGAQVWIAARNSRSRRRTISM
jgi:hypothetical protein